MAYQAPLPPRACSKAWAHHLCVYNGTQCSDCGAGVRLGWTASRVIVAKLADREGLTAPDAEEIVSTVQTNETA
jgi:hypothetical protein